ncbi:MAG: tRNA (adenosine(37)-N6)-threonylcarbamoyltransferase complex dimerization subunit type 1 TsaB [Bacteroidales bacterium]|nr:tRNA (adenosine(37)-N6)-threonylcarbamoyltransferase complex dimerization subunit type 1 TsaB [Bacteroidales bacterium]
MENIILIETSTALCSTALVQNGELILYKESQKPKAHASLTAVFVDEMLKENSMSLQDCSAICVSMGPGSYTGLRVGVSTAKGLCFGGRLPLLAVGTLDTLVWQALGDKEQEWKYIIPMIDARRMEVYTAIFDGEGKQLSDTEPKIIDGDSFAEQLQDGPVLFIGDAAKKCSKVICHQNAHFLQCCPQASAMAVPAIRELKAGNFRDVAYFEPFYLKEFVATVSKKKLF